MTRKEIIETKLREGLAAVHVEVVEDSQPHEGRAGARSGGEHFNVTVVSQRFVGFNSMQAQRLVYQALSAEMGNEIHALRIKALTPQEWEQSRKEPS